MDTSEFDTLISTAAQLVRDQVAQQIAEWQKVPHLSLEANGRGAWSDHYSFPYKLGLSIVDSNWPPRLYVECSTGRLVDSSHTAGIIEANDEEIVRCFMQDPRKFDAGNLVKQLTASATRDDSYNKETNDANREQLRLHYSVVEIHERPANPVRWGYVD